MPDDDPPEVEKELTSAERAFLSYIREIAPAYGETAISIVVVTQKGRAVEIIVKTVDKTTRLR